MPVSILMPSLSPTMTEGNVAKWLKKVGDSIKSGDIIAEVETDKATMEVEAIDEGSLAKIIHNDGAENIAVNTLIGVISLEGETEKDIELFIENQSKDKPEAIAEEEIENDTKLTVETIPENNIDEEKLNEEKRQIAQNKSNDIRLTNENSYSHEKIKLSISPLAKRIADLKNIDINNIQGSGPRGRIIKRDLDPFIDEIEFIDEGKLQNKTSTERQFSTKVPLTNIRKTIATRLQQSKQTVPHFYLKSKVCAEEIIKSRTIINNLDLNEENKIKVSYNDIIIKAVTFALKHVPQMNATWNDDSILKYSLVDIAVAVATDNGLFTPVIRSACKKSISQISTEMKQFILKAKENKLLPDDYNGGTFSISNLGMYNVHEFSAIINPPQSGILAVGEIYEEFQIVEDKPMTVKMINLVLSVDHRIADGATAANFLDKIKFFMENPLGMLA
ncbi:MAG: Dihydrolipoyllysine-residue acetyltransferase component of pyruvate dehydrogenase complex [Alphaproteobacteria bacterium MarineAlpha9_Bin4]|nr:pyruvate dehydrogenase complex dihydrolipoamide acetyltransferase [Pelagibacterales bacterium]PPR27610.1 MAG: Dihydrolipoyllysine-residue acetyltransferase component of pyruvate dehydrogenase complex [Alphaproteobacteria bacterium MarineAlpha9_Bin4]|tara:strand:+ start:2379 stop:3719 length:1341 start_codon:yes stop_codon:yes gene_type:complete